MRLYYDHFQVTITIILLYDYTIAIIILRVAYVYDHHSSTKNCRPRGNAPPWRLPQDHRRCIQCIRAGNHGKSIVGIHGKKIRDMGIDRKSSEHLWELCIEWDFIGIHQPKLLPNLPEPDQLGLAAVPVPPKSPIRRRCPVVIIARLEAQQPGIIIKNDGLNNSKLDFNLHSIQYDIVIQLHTNQYIRTYKIYNYIYIT